MRVYQPKINVLARANGRKFYVDVKTATGRKRIPAHDDVCHCKTDRCEHWQKAQRLVTEYAERQEAARETAAPKPVFSGEKVSAVTWRDKYLAHLRGANRAEKYIVSVERTLKFFLEFCGAHNLQWLPDIKPSHITDFRTELRERHAQKYASVNLHLRNLRAAFSFAEEREWIPRNPASAKFHKELMLKTTDSRKINWLSDEEISEVLGSGETDLRHDVFLLMVYSGLRLGEATHLTWEQVTPTAIHVVSREDWRPKSADRIIPLHPKVKEMLERRRAERKKKSRYVFHTKTGHAVCDRNLQRWMDQLIRKYGLRGVNPPHKLTVHSLRHTFAMALLHRNVPLTDIQRLLGHADLDTTTIYLHADIRQIRAGVEKLDF